MKGQECVDFLQWCLPHLRLRWAGFRRVKNQVCKRLSRRINQLALSNLVEYKKYLEDHDEEWKILDSLCRITISRFYRDRVVFDKLRSGIFPSLAQNTLEHGDNELRCWSAGCCSGEEAYTLQILWKIFVTHTNYRHIPLRIIATDSDIKLLERAEKACYPLSSLRDLPEELVNKAFKQSGELYFLRKNFNENIEFKKQDIRKQLPDGDFSLILYRNLVFTYFEKDLQKEILEKIIEKLIPGGFLVIGIHESLPKGITDVAPYNNTPGIYFKRPPKS